MMNLIHRLRPGLRGKLSLFVGFMLAALVTVIIVVAARQQADTIANAAQQEVTRFLRPVESLTLDIDQVVEGLIQLEALRLRIEEHERRFRNTSPDFHQLYFDERHIEYAERQFRANIRASQNDEPPDENLFKQYQADARWLARNRAHGNYLSRRVALEKRIAAEFDFQNRISIAFEPLDLSRFRSESITPGRFVRFDTRDVARDLRGAPINSFYWIDIPAFKKAMDDIHEPYLAGRPLIEPLRLEHTEEDRDYLLIFRTLFRNPEVSERARLVQETLASAGPWNSYVAAERAYNDELALMADAIRRERERLHNSENPGPPLADPVLYKLYREYRDKRAQRSDLIDTFRLQQFRRTDPDFANQLERRLELREQLSETSDNEEERKRIEEEIATLNETIAAHEAQFTGDEQIADAFRFLRDAAIYHKARIPYVPDQDSYIRYTRDANRRQRTRYYYANFRKWVEWPQSQTYVNPGLVGPGLLVESRREIEERMFELDAMSIEELAPKLLHENVAGFTRILMDRSDSIAAIHAERDRLIDTALSISLRIVFLAFLFSGALVRTIQRIIHGAARVGQGDLNVRFAHDSQDELGELADSLTKMVKGLREREELRGELSAAEEIQKQLIPTGVPSTMEEYVSFGTFYKAMHGVGGDYFDFIRVGNDSMAVCVADVSNHGVGPAIVMTLLRAQLHTILRRGERDPMNIVMELNERTYAETPDNIFITMWLGLYNRKSGQLDYVSAGHNEALVYRYKKESLEALKGGGMPIGAVDNDLLSGIVEARSTSLAPGDLFFQYTDGLSEAMDDEDRMYGEDRVEALLRRFGKKKPASIAQALAVDVQNFTRKAILRDGPSELNDDIAIIAFRRTR